MEAFSSGSCLVLKICGAEILRLCEGLDAVCREIYLNKTALEFMTLLRYSTKHLINLPNYDNHERELVGLPPKDKCATETDISDQLPYSTNDLVKMIKDLEKHIWEIVARLDSLEGDLKNLGRVFSRRFESNDARVQKKINELKQRLEAIPKTAQSPKTATKAWADIPTRGEVDVIRGRLDELERQGDIIKKLIGEAMMMNFDKRHVGIFPWSAVQEVYYTWDNKPRS